MKTFLNLCCAASVVCVLAFAASDLGVPIGIAARKEGVAGTASATPAVPFGPHVRVKVVQYFDTYRTDPLGLPPVCAASIHENGVPPAWLHPGIASIRVIPEEERFRLVDAPPELARILPMGALVGVRYYLAGGSLVAVDSRYKVLDSISIPTVHLGDEVDSAGNTQPLQLVSQMDRRSR